MSLFQEGRCGTVLFLLAQTVRGHPCFRRERPVVNSQLAELRTSQLGVGERQPHASTAAGTYQRDDRELASLCKDGQLHKALGFLLRMDNEGNVPSVRTYKNLLQACTRKKALAEAKRVHSYLAKHGLESDSFLLDFVVSTLIACGGFEDGLHVFQRLAHRTVFSWTSIISGYGDAGKCQEAMSCYEQMQKEGVHPNTYTFVGLLKACSRSEDLERGKQVHAAILKHGYESDVFIGSSLVSMYAKCGSILDAQQVFDGLSNRDVVSWNSMMAAYAQQDRGEMALQLYARMQAEGVRPNARTLVSALQACGTLAEKQETATEQGRKVMDGLLQRGKQLHHEAAARGFESDMFVGNSLVSLYAKCGSVMDAQQVFDNLSHRDVVSWTALVAAYAQQSQGVLALKIFKQMHEEGIRPDARTYVSALQACGSISEQEEKSFVDGQHVKLQSLQKGKKIHAEAASRRFDSDVFIANTLVSMYAKCGSIRDAQHVFDSMSHRDVVSCNAIIAACVQEEQAKQALKLYWQVRDEGVTPNARMIVSMLQACCILAEKEQDTPLDGHNLKVESLHKGHIIHAEAAARGFESDIFVPRALIRMYAKCQSIKDAQEVFDRLCHRDVLSWTTMIAAYTEQGQGEAALQIYRQLRQEGVRPDVWTFVSALQACGTLAEREEGVLVHGHLVKVDSLQWTREIHADAGGREVDVHVLSTLIGAYAKCGSITEARIVFQGLSCQDVVSWNAMIAAYVQQDQGASALETYQQMLARGIYPDARTFVSTLQACGSIAEKEPTALVQGQTVKVNALTKGREIHAEAEARSFAADVFVGNTLVSMYSRCGSIMDARKVFDALPHRDVVSWNAMISAYSQQGQWGNALQLYKQVQGKGLNLDEASFLCVLEACGNTGALDICRHIHRSIVESGLECRLPVATSLIHAYGKCASMVDAQNVFDSLPEPDVVSWTALIAGYARQGAGDRSIRCFEKMYMAGTKPNNVTLLALLSACSHGGMVDKGVEYFQNMARDHGISPEVEHYVCMIDLLGRAGLFREAENLLTKMPMQPNWALWLCLLSACRKHGNVVLGRRAFDCAVALEPEQASPYVLMSNLYAHAGQWDRANEIDELWQRAGALKKPGQSWIEHDDEVHTFMVEDRKHPELYTLLRKIYSELKAVEFVA